jgi:hypothetical protein
MSKLTTYKQVLIILEKLHKAHPTYNMGRHISTALDGSDIWGMPDREVLIALQKYEASLEMDVNHTDEEDIDFIIKEGMNLRGIFSNDIEEEEEY